MTGLTVHIPTLETDRLILRAPRMEDFEPMMDFMETDRSKFVGGPTERRNSMRGFGHIAGLWVTRGYSLFIGERKDAPGTPIGAFGPFYPLSWPELEFGWSIWDAGNEGKGYVTEALRVLIPWTWDKTGAETAVSFIDADNPRSVNVAKALGAVHDPESTTAMNQPGSPFYDEEDVDILVYRHTKGALQ